MHLAMVCLWHLEEVVLVNLGDVGVVLLVSKGDMARALLFKRLDLNKDLGSSGRGRGGGQQGRHGVHSSVASSIHHQRI